MTEWATDISIWEDVVEHRADDEARRKIMTDHDQCRTVVRRLDRRVELLEAELRQSRRLNKELASRLALVAARGMVAR